MNDHELRRQYARLSTRTDPDRVGCLAPENVMRLAAGEAAEAERLEWLEHVSTCPACRADLELARAVAEAGQALQRRPIPVPWLALAASVVLFAGGVALWRAAGTADDVMRGGEDRLTLVAPIGTITVAAADRFVWRNVPEASFEVEVLDAGGAPVFVSSSYDTIAMIPVAMLQPGVEYRWRVTAVLSDGRRLRSAAEPLRIKP